MIIFIEFFVTSTGMVDSVNEEQRVVSYARVSSIEQAKGYSIEAQNEAVIECCKRKSWRYVGKYEDPGFSGSTKERPGLIELLLDAQLRKFDLVLVHNVDRLSRNQSIFWQVIEELHEYGIRFSWTEMPEVDSSKIEFSLIGGVLSAQSEYFRKNLIQKTRMGLEVAKKKGVHIGRPPLGFVAQNGKLVPNELGAKALKIFRINPSVQAAQMSRELGLTYHQAWELRSTCSRTLRDETVAETDL